MAAGIRVVSMVMAATLLLFMVMAARSDWLGDYASNVRCCTDIPEGLCDPSDPLANNACRDVCHYGSCSKGGQCEYRGSGLGFGRVCHCNC
ncbi:hypothetical protein COCNU_07G006370 [Cocos nucifera]|uniref:Uncharacterized protein n=1 Tax=Cocos nucifera TaxID=13894 RepID=A0A8K0IES4_COCNU|nr:hypothetical protein COCNU_07G006370 [Cocos nucifera]